MATDRAADVRIRGNAPVGGRNAFSAAEQARLDAARDALVSQVTVPTGNVSTGISEQTDWIEQLRLIFSNYGLDSLAPKITEFIQMGYSPDTVTLKLQETPEYKQRFIGNETRRKAGLPVLSPAEYLSVESSYKKIMKDAELPAGFYDQPEDFGKFIGSDISPTELQERVSIANQSIQNADPFYTDSLRRFYGLNTGDMLAYALDPERALPAITRQQKAAQFGAEAARQGIQIAQPMAERFTGQLGVTQEQARTGFEQVATILPEAQKLSQITAGAQPFGLEETTTAVFGGESSADYKKRLQRLADIEQSRFAGQAGVGQPSLRKTTQGQF
jgi:hypothetical protein